MNLDNIHHHGMFCQKVRAAQNVFEKLQALEEYERHMDAVENDMLQARNRLEVHHFGKTAD